MGFTTPKIKKNNMKGGITNAMNNIKKLPKKVGRSKITSAINQQMIKWQDN